MILLLIKVSLFYHENVETLEKNWGFINNLFKILPLNASQYIGFLDFKGSLFNPDTCYLTNADKEMIGVVVSSVNCLSLIHILHFANCKFSHFPVYCFYRDAYRVWRQATRHMKRRIHIMANLKLWDTVKELKSPKYKWVDLTHCLLYTSRCV